MSFFTRTDVMIPIVTAIIAAVATSLASVLPIWIKFWIDLRVYPGSYAAAGRLYMKGAC